MDSRQGVASIFSCPFAFTRDFGLSLVRNLPPRSQRENDRMLFHDSKNLFLSTRREKGIKNDPKIFLRGGEEKRIDNWKIGFFLQRKGMDRKSSFWNEWICWSNCNLQLRFFIPIKLTLWIDYLAPEENKDQRIWIIIFDT